MCGESEGEGRCWPVTNKEPLGRGLQWLSFRDNTLLTVGPRRSGSGLLAEKASCLGVPEVKAVS